MKLKSALPIFLVLFAAVSAVSQTTTTTPLAVGSGCVHDPAIYCYPFSTTNYEIIGGNAQNPPAENWMVYSGVGTCFNPQPEVLIPGGFTRSCSGIDAHNNLPYTIVLTMTYQGYHTSKGERYTITGGSISLTE